ncbi:MAG: B12-binding domain-containing radical SAM protein [Deltaproteobacteria bacterium]|nr:B12-binding domain-containing radical SAM protein [Deltaproteobacteria bacterium]
MYLSSCARQRRKDEPMLLDLRFSKKPLRDVYDTVRSFKPDIVGISAITLEAELMHHIARTVKRVSAGIPVIAGGPHATIFHDEILADDAVDIAVIGEGEETFIELLDVLDHKSGLSSVHGIAYKEGSRPIKTPLRKLIDDLDTLPFPAWDDIDRENYAHVKSSSVARIGPYMPLFTSRGCPFHCTYCHNIFGKQFRSRSVSNVLGEVDTLVKRYGIRDFEIMDDISNFNSQRFKCILRGIISMNQGIRLTFPSGIRADIADEELIGLMGQAGTKELTVAIESASSRIQKLIKKNLDIEKVKDTIDRAAEAGIFVKGNFMIGFPDETEEEIVQTIDFACNSKLHVAAFFIVVPFEGTELTEQMKKEGKLRTLIEYKDYDFYAMPFNGSAVPDRRFFKLYKHAYRRFYMNPKRLLRILKTRPLWKLAIAMGIKVLMYSLFNVRGNTAVKLDGVDDI